MGYIEDVNTQLNRLQTKLANCYGAISDKGGTLPQIQNYDNLANSILSIAGSSASVTVDADAGLTVNAIKGNKVRPCIWNGSAYYNNQIDEYGEWTVVATDSGDPNAILTGTGDSSYCYATINGTKRYGEGTYTVQSGDTIVFGVYGRSSSNKGTVVIDGTTVLSVTNQSTRTYQWTVPEVFGDISISFSYTSSSSSRHGTITVTFINASAIFEVLEPTNYQVAFVSSLVGTSWRFIEHPDWESCPYNISKTINGEHARGFNLVFSSNSATYKYIDWSTEASSCIYYESSFFAEDDDDYIVAYDSTWQKTSYRTINITGGTFATNKDFIAWLNINAVKL